MPRPVASSVASPATLSRRALIGGIPLLLAGCAGIPVPSLPDLGSMFGDSPDYDRLYRALPDEQFPIPALNWRTVEPDVLRRIVSDPTGEAPGTVVVDPNARHLYLVYEGGQAMRYGIGVGKQGFEWEGRATIGRKAEWPTWTPTLEMIGRDPEKNGPWARGMPPGLGNPLGARALYLFQGGRDTLYRIHGTNEPRSIGKAVSSGCVRMFNHDVIDLYRRLPVGTTVVVR